MIPDRRASDSPDSLVYLVIPVGYPDNLGGMLTYDN